MAIHKFGKIVNGVRAVFFGTLDDKEFNRVTVDGLPRGWFCFHLEEEELVDPVSERVEEIRKMPVIDAVWRDQFRIEIESKMRTDDDDYGFLPVSMVGAEEFNGLRSTECPEK